ncbi:MAG: hypothetical protein ABR887_06725 [Methanoregulaceae archaeon]
MANSSSRYHNFAIGAGTREFVAQIDRVGRAVLFAEPAAEAAIEFYVGPFLAYDLLALDLDLRLIRNHCNALRRAYDGAPGTSDTLVFNDNDLSAECLRDRDFFLRVQDCTGL